MSQRNLFLLDFNLGLFFLIYVSHLILHGIDFFILDLVALIDYLEVRLQIVLDSFHISKKLTLMRQHLLNEVEDPAFYAILLDIGIYQESCLWFFFSPPLDHHDIADHTTLLKGNYYISILINFIVSKANQRDEQVHHYERNKNCH